MHKHGYQRWWMRQGLMHGVAKHHRKNTNEDRSKLMPRLLVVKPSSMVKQNNWYMLWYSRIRCGVILP